MDENVNYSLVGLFVIGLFATIVMTVIWLSSGFSFEKYTIYQVRMTESIAGMAMDSPVEFNGVKVGAVTNVDIDDKNPRIVDVLIKVKSNTPITVNTRAKINVRNLAGVAFMLLEDDGENPTRLIAEPGQKYPLIKTAPSLLLRLDDALKLITRSFHQLNQSIESLLDKENMRTFKNVLKESQQALLLLQRQTIPAANNSISNLDAVLQNLTNITNQLKQNPSILIRGLQPGTLGPGEQ